METVNHEYYVSLEVAKLLKKAGFNWEVKSYRKGLNGTFEITSIPNNFNDVTLTDWISAPTLDVAQRWLREVKGFMVETTFITDEYGILYQANLYKVVSEKAAVGVSELISVVKGQTEIKRTYEEAQEAGIKKALEIILEKGE